LKDIPYTFGMRTSDLGLNPEQDEAVHTIDGPLLIIAGAGSGKTRVITFRIAHMLECHIPQSAILALTFTNKAAREMEERAKQLTGRKLTNLTVSTFHAFGVQVLREKGEALGYRPNFTIYDTDDSFTLLKECARVLEQSWELAELQAIAQQISAVKSQRKGWSDEPSEVKKLYQEYAEHLMLYNAVDFDDLITKPLELFEKHADILGEYRERYRYIMVDEFQDTSITQFRFVELLAREHHNLCVVGDDDQSIYSWRGANFENILLFEQHFPERKEIKLEQNYRSTGAILAAANALILNNTNRKEKALWTQADAGKAIELVHPEDETKEAQFITETIKTLVFRENRKYDDFGILVRTNSLTKNIEMQLLATNIPYKMSGGTSFFQRKEVKDVIAYLRVLTNPRDNVNFLRVLNTPRRGAGKVLLETLNRVSQLKSISLFDALKDILLSEQAPISDQARADLSEFLELIGDYRKRARSPKGKFAAHLKELLEDIAYWEFLLADNPNSDKVAKWKWQNVESLMKFLDDWENDPEAPRTDLMSFLNRITLITRDDLNDKEDKGSVSLMTIHASKGLEFNVVFLMGVEDKILPHERSIEEGPHMVEEERRLFYVAITRARQKLYMTACTTRRTLKETFHPEPSPFLTEIPGALLNVTDGTPEQDATVDDLENLMANLKKVTGA
jgi:DNA helicase-2/ATP-dependent DNA helicase PcrA